MNIYTKNGDMGMTKNFLGEAVSKGSQILELQGTVDEVNSFTGLLISKILENTDGATSPDPLRLVVEELKAIQKDLFILGSDIATGFTQSSIPYTRVTDLENSIDSMLNSTGELHRFLYLAGHETATTAHCLRSITRRCERVYVRYLQSSQLEVPDSYKYLNRLADYFFQVARYLNHLFEVEETYVTLD